MDVGATISNFPVGSTQKRGKKRRLDKKSAEIGVPRKQYAKPNRTQLACFHCWKSKTKCDAGRPCKRCRRKNILSCIDRPSHPKIFRLAMKAQQETAKVGRSPLKKEIEEKSSEKWATPRMDETVAAPSANLASSQMNMSFQVGPFDHNGVVTHMPSNDMMGGHVNTRTCIACFGGCEDGSGFMRGDLQAEYGNVLRPSIPRTSISPHAESGNCDSQYQSGPPRVGYPLTSHLPGCGAQFSDGHVSGMYGGVEYPTSFGDQQFWGGIPPRASECFNPSAPMAANYGALSDVGCFAGPQQPPGYHHDIHCGVFKVEQPARYG